MNSETLSMIVSDNLTSNDKLLKEAGNLINCACIGIIETINLEDQTIDVQPVITRTVSNKNLSTREEKMPLLMDVPFCCYKGGGYSITVPIRVGDEVLIVFADNDFSAWFQSGGIQPSQSLFGRHHLSNAVAILGISSIPNAIPNYNPNAIEIRNSDGSEKISLSTGNITLKSATITLDGETTIQGKKFLEHVHGNGNQGKNTTGVQ